MTHQNEPADIPSLGDIEEAPPGATFAGRIETPEGPLENWPFHFLRDRVRLDPMSLGGGSSNAHDGRSWRSGARGEFAFEDLPPGFYAIEVLLPGGRIVYSQRRPPPGAAEDGYRARHAGAIDPGAYDEDPVAALASQAAISGSS